MSTTNISVCFSLKILGGGGDNQTFQMAALTTDGANVMDGTKMTGKELHTSRTESPGPAKMVGAKKKYRSRSASASSLDSASSGSYTGIQRLMRICFIDLYYHQT